MSDTKLWGQLKEGNRNAFKEIFDSHIQLLYKYGYKFCQDPELVEDCIQDLFLRLWEKRENLGTTDNIKFYLMVALKRSIYQRIKKKGDLSLSEQDEQDVSFSMDFTIEEALIKNETDHFQKEKLLQCLEELSNRQKEVIYLRFYQGMKPEEVAEIMNINNQSVRNLQSSALKKMKDDLGDIYVLALIASFANHFV